MSEAPIKILLVEDNPGDARLLRQELVDSGGRFELTPVIRLSEAVARMGETWFDAILLDLGLPDSQGLNTLTAVHAQAPDVAIVVLTGLNDESTAIQALREGAQDYLVKGQGDGRWLTRALRYAIERKQAEVALRAKSTEVNAMSQQLWQAAKLATMGELTASIAHELNNPLGTVSLWVESLLAQIPADDPRHRTLGIIEQEVERMSALVANLLQFSRRGSQQISTIDVREEIAKTLEVMHYHLRNCHVTVTQEFAPDVPMIQADRQLLRQLFLNLFTNACDAMPQGGILAISVSATGNDVIIQVADTGTGITPEDLPRVMDPFFTTKPEGKGTGLGLAICRRIVQDHRGKLEIASDGVPGKGTTVRITLSRTNGTNGSYLREA